MPLLAYPNLGERRVPIAVAGAAALVLQTAFFGDPLESALIDLKGSSEARAIGQVRPMTLGTQWAPASNARMVALGAIPASDFAMVLTQADADGEALVMLSDSPDGRTGYEVGIIKVSGAFKMVIRRVIEAQLVDEDSGGSGIYAVPQAVGDVPETGNAIADAPASVVSGQPVRIEARWVGQRIELRINDGAVVLAHNVAAATYNPKPDTSTFAPKVYDKLVPIYYAGFVTRSSSARVLAASLYDLRGQRSSRDDVVVAVVGGDVYASQEGSMLPVAVNVFDPADSVSIQEFAGKVYMVGGGKARVFDPLRRIVTPWNATAGTLPGRTGSGTTTATGLGKHGTRITLHGVTGDEQNLYESATGNALDLNIERDSLGRAFTTAGTRPLKTGQPIIKTLETTVGALVVACASSIELVTGDPVFGNIDTRQLHPNISITGPGAMIRVGDGQVLMHTPNGLMTQVGLSPPVEVTKPFLTDIVQDIPEGSTVTLAHDAKLSYDLLFITPPTGQGVHLIRDQRVAGWNHGLGGVYPITLPESMQPVVAVPGGFNGRALLGCLDGYLRWFDASASTDDGEPITCRASLQVMDPPGSTTEIELSRLEADLLMESQPAKICIYGGATSELAYGVDTRTLLGVFEQVPDVQEVWMGPVRAPALVIELEGTAPLVCETIAIEAAQRKGATWSCRHGR
jgi:hypothetical protein